MTTKPARYGRQRATVLVDLDGTLADVAHRLPILSDGLPHRWERFFERVCVDPPMLGVVLWTQGLALKYDVIVVSARSSATREASEAWLAEQGVPYLELLMRDEGDQRDDREIKREMLMWLRAEGRRIAFVVDDRPRVVEMWRAEGLKVYPVHQDRWEGEKGEIDEGAGIA